MSRGARLGAADRDRSARLLLDLVRIYSHSRREGAIAVRLARECEALGASVEIDEAGRAVGGETGNLVVRVRGSRPDATPLLLSAHMDTVIPGEGITPVVDGPLVRSDGRTILGGDDKAGCVIILETLRLLRERGLPHGDLEVVLTVCEEIGLLGAKALDAARLAARTGLVFDSEGAGLVYNRQPACDHLEFTVEGLAAHAGVSPERGISAIRIAAEGVAAMRLGRVDAGTTANIGSIEAGGPLNVVPNRAHLRVEVRALDEAALEGQCRHIRECLDTAAARHIMVLDGRRVEPRVTAMIARQYPAMHVAQEAPVFRLVQAAAARLGQRLEAASSCGSSDANILNARGIACVDLGTGMHDIHTAAEWMDLREMWAAIELTLEIVALQADVPRP